jgi:YD repeat-containing protein
MRLLEMAEQMARRAEAAGGPQYLVPPGWADPTGANADRRWRPVPHADGSLTVDPEFSLPTAAGPLEFRLFHSPVFAESGDPSWGASRGASVSLQLLDTAGSVVVDREDGNVRQYADIGGGVYQIPAFQYQNGDKLVKNGDGTWDETHGDTGYRYHFPPTPASPPFYPVSVLYRETPQGLRLTYNYDSSQRLSSILEPAGRRFSLSYNAANQVQVIEDWAGRGLILLTYVGTDLTEVWEPEGVVTRYGYDASHRVTSITDPEGYITTYTYSGDQVRTRNVAGSITTYVTVQVGRSLAPPARIPGV